MIESAAITLRRARPADGPAIARLAELDGAPPPREPLLVAEVLGQLRAAISLADGAVVADPFHPTLALLELLRARERQLRGGPWWRRRRLPRWSRRRTATVG